MTAETFEKGMAILLAAFPGLEARPVAIEAWFELLEDMDEGDFVRAVREICRNERQIFPGTNVVALLRERAQGDAASASLRALLLVEDAFLKVGAYRTPEFSDPAIAVTIERMGGWEALCAMEIAEWKFARKEFERIYRDFAKNGLPAEIPRLVGIHERKNALAGHDVAPAVVRIGQEKHPPAAIAGGSR